LNLVKTLMRDGVKSIRGVMVFRDGTMLGGGSNLYTVGNYTCSDGKWKGISTKMARAAGSISPACSWEKRIRPSLVRQ
jgi:hypothetical protein